MKRRIIVVIGLGIVIGVTAALAHAEDHRLLRIVSAAKVVPPSVQTPPEHVVTIDVTCDPAHEEALCDGFSSLPANGGLSFGFYAAHILKYKPIIDADNDRQVGCRLIEYSRAVQNTVATVWAACVPTGE